MTCALSVFFSSSSFEQKTESKKKANETPAWRWWENMSRSNNKQKLEGKHGFFFFWYFFESLWWDKKKKINSENAASTTHRLSDYAKRRKASLVIYFSKLNSMVSEMRKDWVRLFRLSHNRLLEQNQCELNYLSNATRHHQINEVLLPLSPSVLHLLIRVWRHNLDLFPSPLFRLLIVTRDRKGSDCQMFYSSHAVGVWESERESTDGE